MSMTDPMSTDHRTEALLLWQLHDTLLQAYRGQFFSFQAIAVAAGILVLQGMSPFSSTVGHWVVFLALIAFGPVFVGWVWRPLVRHRGHMVASAQLLLTRDKFLTEPPFVWLGKASKKGTDEYRDAQSDPRYAELRGGPTRVKLDKLIPLAFFVVWLGILGWWLSTAIK
jgi:hypothetical protein